MKNIIISAEASRQSGALTIYKQMIAHLREHVNGNYYMVFVDESMPRPEIAGVEYVTVNVRNGKGRMLFDYWDCKRMLREHGVEPDLVISLQNTGVWCLRGVHQVIYYHQPLPLYPQRWNPLRREERRLAFYKYAYPLFVKNSIRTDRVDFVAQIPFIKEGIERKYGIARNRVHVMFPVVENVDVGSIANYDFESGTRNWIYPATAVKYKNHLLLVRMMSVIKREAPDFAKEVRIHFTLGRGENREMERITETEGVTENFVYHGSMPHDMLLAMLKASCGLLFPSEIETLGLPLIEAAKLGKRVVAADLPYAHQVLNEYEGACFVDIDNIGIWADSVRRCSDDIMSFKPLGNKRGSSWDSFFELIDNILKERDKKGVPTLVGGANLRFRVCYSGVDLEAARSGEWRSAA